MSDKRRVLIFDDEPQTNKKLVQALINAGFEVVAPQSIKEAMAAINVGDAKALIHCSHHTKTYWKICEEIFQAHPKFPSLHIAVGPLAEDFQRQFKGAFHQKMRPLPSQKAFINKVNKLIFLGNMDQQNTHYKNLLDVRESMEELIDCQTFFDLKQKATLLFMDLFKAGNVLFFDAGEALVFQRKDLHEAEVYNLTSFIEEEHRVIAAKYTTPVEIQNFLKSACTSLPIGWEKQIQSHLHIDPQNVGQRHSDFIVVPIASLETGKVLGHVFIIEPQNHGAKLLNEVLPLLQRSLTRYCEKVLSFMQLKDMSYIDDLTELYNQRYLKLALDKEINRAQRSNTSFSVLFMDIDHFKRVNDNRGHVVGSKVLKKLSKIINDNIRTVDYGFRYGGDEFIMVLVGSNAEQAKVVAERTRKQVEESVFDIEGTQIKVTLSIGIASFPEHATTKEQILEMADQAMYVGKNKSRNIVFVAS